MLKRVFRFIFQLNQMIRILLNISYRSYIGHYIMPVLMQRVGLSVSFTHGRVLWIALISHKFRHGCGVAVRNAGSVQDG